ncbi:MAG: YbjN domain-containing protein [Acidimicrobiia bacterium]|nr:YbjN domain-containing protein [Acidimicrobiia bacterium]
MPASRADAERRLVTEIEAQIADPESDIVAIEAVEGRWAVRMKQHTRDFTTIWFDVGERSVQAEAYLLPAPPKGHTEVYRQCLVRNPSTWRVRFGLDQEGAIVLKGRIAIGHFSAPELSLLVAEIYDQVERAFRPLLRAGWEREK